MLKLSPLLVGSLWKGPVAFQQKMGSLSGISGMGHWIPNINSLPVQCSYRPYLFTSDVNLSFPFLIHILFHAQLSTVVGVSWWHVVALVETWNLEDWGNQAQVSSSWLLYTPNDEVREASCKQAYLHTRHNLVKLVYRAWNWSNTHENNSRKRNTFQFHILTPILSLTNAKLLLVRNPKAENEKSKWNICPQQKLQSGGG